jgi:hypothetical protein
MKTLSQDSQSPGQDLNPGTLKYEEGVLYYSAMKFGKTFIFPQNFKLTGFTCVLCNDTVQMSQSKDLQQ